MADYLENTLCRPRQLKIFIPSLASTVVDVADYLENASNSYHRNGTNPYHQRLRLLSPLGESEREVSPFSSFHVPQPAGVADYLENASGVPSPLTPLPINRARGNGKSEGQNTKLNNLTVALLPRMLGEGQVGLLTPPTPQQFSVIYRFVLPAGRQRGADAACGLQNTVVLDALFLCYEGSSDRHHSRQCRVSSQCAQEFTAIHRLL